MGTARIGAVMLAISPLVGVVDRALMAFVGLPRSGSFRVAPLAQSFENQFSCASRFEFHGIGADLRTRRFGDRSNPIERSCSRWGGDHTGTRSIRLFDGGFDGCEGAGHDLDRL
jgi:hypothetical protein